MGIILTGGIGEVTRGIGMIPVVRAVGGFAKESIRWSSFPTLEIGKVSLMALS